MCIAPPRRSAKRLLAAEQPGVRLHEVTTQPHMVPAEGTAPVLPLYCFHHTVAVLHSGTAGFRRNASDTLLFLPFGLPACL